MAGIAEKVLLKINEAPLSTSLITWAMVVFLILILIIISISFKVGFDKQKAQQSIKGAKGSSAKGF